MTALDRYDRLEALGLWRDTLDDTGREVVVKFGEATLVILSVDDDPITHWSLSAIREVEKSATKTVYAVDGDVQTTLTITEPPMQEALGKVLEYTQVSGDKLVSKKSRVRPWAIGLSLLAVLALVIISPTLMRDFAHRMISPQRSQVLAAEMLPLIEERTGPACKTPMGSAALMKIARRLTPDGSGTLHVLDLGDAPVIALPGGHVVLNSEVIRNASGPSEIAGWAATGLAGSAKSPALSGLFDSGGTWDGIKFLLTGDLPERAMNRSINRLLISPKILTPEVEVAVVDLMKRASVHPGALVAGLRREGLSTSLVPWIDNSEPAQVLNDDEWVAIQSICEG